MTIWTEQIAPGMTMYRGDCRDILPAVGQVDAVVTDPPYGVNKAEWDSAYPEWIEELSFRCARAVVIMPGMWAIPACLRGMGERYRGIIAGRNLNGMTFGPIGFNNWIPAVCGGDIPHRGQDCFEFTVGGEKPDHPSPKPLPYMLKLVERVTEPEWTVADPFAGSGTTGIACAKLGRFFIGIESDPAHFDLACRRISDALRQSDMFVGRVAPMRQTVMHF